MDAYERIKLIRKSRGWTQTDLAVKTGYADKSMIARIENGQVDITLSKLKIFADALGVSSEYLFGIDELQDQQDRLMVYSARIKDLEKNIEITEKIDLLDSVDRERILERIDTMLESDKYHKEDDK